MERTTFEGDDAGYIGAERDALIRRTISDVINERLGDAAEIVGVDVKPELDDDGDAILVITVVFDAEKSALDPDRVLGMVRHLRQALAKVRVNDFPLLSYVSKEDAKTLKHAAA